MKRRGIQLSTRHRRWFYFVAVLLFLSGATWVLFDWLTEHGYQGENSFGQCKSWSLRLHGAGAMAFLVSLGILIPTHIKRAWQARRNRVNGAIFVTAMLVLAITGYGLYYFGDERWRAAAAWSHSILGFAAPALLVLHIALGRRATSR
jgi:hypothetical protein